MHVFYNLSFENKIKLSSVIKTSQNYNIFLSFGTYLKIILDFFGFVQK